MRKNQIQYTFQNSCQEKRSPNNCTCNKQSRPRQLTHDNETWKKRSGISASTHPQPIEHPKQTTHTTTETAAYFKQRQKREEWCWVVLRLRRVSLTVGMSWISFIKPFKSMDWVFFVNVIRCILSRWDSNIILRLKNYFDYRLENLTGGTI